MITEVEFRALAAQGYNRIHWFWSSLRISIPRCRCI